jgi:hypothetical protein|tara:strand:+ start:381 stop:812 length:432 start_codon:yes stop_codon:yes gene_type:complete
MARRIRFDQIGDYAEERFNALLRVAVLETDQRLKVGSPIGKTGRLRASWQISENQADGKGKPKGDYGYSILPPDRTNYKEERMGNSYIVYNNIEYAEPVIAGNNMPPSWNNRWRSRGNQIKQNYHLTVAKDIQNFIKANATDP